MPPLKNQRWESFAQLIAEKVPQGKAYKKAGYKGGDSSASTLAGKPEIQERVQELTRGALAETSITIEWWIETVRANIERAMEARPVLRIDTMVAGEDDGGERSMEVMGSYTYNGAVANKGLELLGKHIGAFKADNDQQPQPGGAIIVQYPANNR